MSALLRLFRWFRPKRSLAELTADLEVALARYEAALRAAHDNTVAEMRAREAKRRVA